MRLALTTTHENGIFGGVSEGFLRHLKRSSHTAMLSGIRNLPFSACCEMKGGGIVATSRRVTLRPAVSGRLTKVLADGLESLFLQRGSRTPAGAPSLASSSVPAIPQAAAQGAARADAYQESRAASDQSG
jgi:hypothetical protein